MASSIGWENRKSNQRKRNVNKEKSQSNRIDVNDIKESRVDSGSTELSADEAVSPKKRARTSLQGDFSIFKKETVTSFENHQAQRESQTTTGSCFGPQLPSSENDQPKLVVKMPIISEPSEHKDIKVSKSHIGKIVTFDLRGESRSQRIVINGRARVKAIDGSFDIVGYRLSSTSKKSIVVDSPNWMSAICIEPSIRRQDSDYNQDEGSSFQESACILLSSLSTEDCTFQISSPQESRIISITEKWENIATEIIQGRNENTGAMNDKTLVCGAKGTGKSTFCRYLVNRLLSENIKETDEGDYINNKKVALLDFDVGQPEFSTPGIMSMTMISDPILSPPHAHIVRGQSEARKVKDVFSLAKKHEKAYFFGFTTSKANPVRFMSAVKCLLEDIDNLQRDPTCCGLVINTDGWVKGMGYEILSTLIDAAEPNQIVQLIGSTRAKFFDLAPHAKENRTIHVAEVVGGKIYDPISATPPLSRATSTASMQSLQDGSNFDPSLSDKLAPIASSLTRSLRLLTYFVGGYESLLSTGATFDHGGLFDDDCNVALKLSILKPYMVPFESVQCLSLNEDGKECLIGEESFYEEYNSSIVALCGDGDRESISICYGLGIVRSIDRRRRVFFIITPVDASILQSCVKTVVKGQIQLPLQGKFCGVFSESFPFMSFDGTSVGIGNEMMKSKNVFIRK